MNRHTILIGIILVLIIFFGRTQILGQYEEFRIERCVKDIPFSVAVVVHNGCAYINDGAPITHDEFNSCVDSEYVDYCRESRQQ